jgi:DNA polymerase-1
MIADDGRIHTTFAQTVAATGRLSSVDPNLQNIPIRTELGKQIRKAFIPAPGFQLASLDYSQIELRLLAHECKEDALVHAFLNHQDVHAATASTMWQIKVEDVTPRQRRYAKMLNYAVPYGVTNFGLANQLGGEFTVEQTKEMITTYFKRFPKIRGYIDKTLEIARSRGFTTTILGRRRYFPDIHAGNRVARQYAERQAINAPLQGGSADLIKAAMIKIQPMLSDKRSRMVLQVHDELIFEIADGEETLLDPIREAMETAIQIDVPIDVDVSIGQNWLEAK